MKYKAKFCTRAKWPTSPWAHLARSGSPALILRGAGIQSS